MIAASVKSILEFMDDAVEDDGSNVKAITDQQFVHCMAMIRRTKVDHADATKALALLKTDNKFEVDQRRALRSALTERVGSSSEPSTVRKTTDAQTNSHIEFYLSEKRWDILQSGCKHATKLEEVTDMLHEIGCDHPDPATQCRAVAVTLAADDNSFSDLVAYNLVNEMRDQLHHKRKRRAAHAVHLNQYPEDPSEYIAMAPKALAERPVASKISEAIIFRTLRRVSNRSTNSKVREQLPTQPVQPMQGYGYGYGYSSPPSGQRYGRKQRMLMHGAMDAPTGMHRSRSRLAIKDRDVDSDSRSRSPDRRRDRRSRRNSSPLAIKDRDSAAASPPKHDADARPDAKDDKNGDDPHGLDTMIDALTKAKKVATKAAAMKRPAAADIAKRPAASSRVSKADQVASIKLKGGWTMKVVPRGGRGGHYNLCYPLYRYLRTLA